MTTLLTWGNSYTTSVDATRYGYLFAAFLALAAALTCHKKLTKITM